MNNTIKQIWERFTKASPAYVNQTLPPHYYFCDNEHDANECAELVVKGIKQATAGSLWSYNQTNEALPKVGQLYIITNWNKQAKAIVEITKIEQVAFKNITEHFAATEGEGDKSFSYWRKVHWDFFTREMKSKAAKPTEDMIIVCEYFKTIYP